MLTLYTVSIMWASDSIVNETAPVRSNICVQAYVYLHYGALRHRAMDYGLVE